MNPDFAVPPEYFYALGASLPPEITPEQRYELATGMSEEQVRVALRKAADARVIDAPVVIAPGPPPVTMNVAQAGRRLRALGTVGALPSRHDVPPGPHPAPGTPLF